MHFPQEAIGDALPKQGGKTQVDNEERKWSHNISENKGVEKGKQILQ